MYRVCIILLTALSPVWAAAHAGEAASPVSGERVRFREVDYDLVKIDVKHVQIKLYWKQPDGRPFHNFVTLADWLKAQHEHMLFATNAGIYARDYTPMGLHVEEGKASHPLNRKRGGGNFFLKPNGVFWIDTEGAHVLETEAYFAANPAPRVAVQSGPMLVTQGALHPAFKPESESKYLRNGVCAPTKDLAVFVISRAPVNFHTFASFFREHIGCKDALYLDGALSAMYAPCVGRDDPGLDYVGILAASERETP